VAFYQALFGDVFQRRTRTRQACETDSAVRLRRAGEIASAQRLSDPDDGFGMHRESRDQTSGEQA
jgi:hypothetical protein